MHKIVTVEEMRLLEANADAAGVSYAEMMELAGAALADVVKARLPEIEDVLVVVLTGPGNNGGDGLVAGRILAEAGATVKFYFLQPPDEDDPNVQLARAAGLFMADAENDQRWRVLKNMLRGVDVLIDALFGTGVRLPLSATASKVLQQVSKNIAAAEKVPLRVAVDVPSGFDSDTGEIDQSVLRADMTITFGAAKVGQFRFPGADVLGELVLAEIGWPAKLKGLAAITLDLADDSSISALLPPRPRNAHKGTFGTALVIAGSVNYTGAAFLAAKSAYLGGAGLVTAGIPMGLHGIIAAQLPEATWVILPSDMGVIADGAVSIAREATDNVAALLLGPGWGTEKATLVFLRGLLSGASEKPSTEFGFQLSDEEVSPSTAETYGSLPPLVVDADGLKLLAKIEAWPGRIPPETILTPHPGEMAILTDLPKDDIQADRIGFAQRFSAEWGHIIVLKGAFTIVAAPDGRTTMQPFATAALARAGTGDVLAGLIVGLLAQGMEAYEAAVAGTYIHGLAGELAADQIGTTASVLAGDVMELIPKALVALKG